MGQTALLPFWKKACWGFFVLKNPTASVGFEPANLGTKGQHATSRLPKPLQNYHNTNWQLLKNVRVSFLKGEDFAKFWPMFASEHVSLLLTDVTFGCPYIHRSPHYNPPYQMYTQYYQATSLISALSEDIPSHFTTAYSQEQGGYISPTNCIQWGNHSKQQ